MTNELSTYIRNSGGDLPSASNLNDLSNLSSFTGDIVNMANSIEKMGDSITILTDYAQRQLAELLEYVPSKSVIVPVAVFGGLLLGGFLATGIIKNVKAIKK